MSYLHGTVVLAAPLDDRVERDSRLRGETVVGEDDGYTIVGAKDKSEAKRAVVLGEARALLSKATPPSGHVARILVGFGYACLDRADHLAQTKTGPTNFLQRWVDEAQDTRQTRANQRALLDETFRRIPQSDEKIANATWEAVRKATSAAIAEYAGQMGGAEYISKNLGAEAWLDAWGDAFKNLPRTVGTSIAWVVKEVAEGAAEGSGLADWWRNLAWWKVGLGVGVVGLAGVAAFKVWRR